jgi:NADH-quinone oxidoreductase subunit N
MSDEAWFNSTEHLDLLEPFLEIGLTFIIFSLLIKLAVAPFHIWSLDVYEGSPTISTFFFAVITKLSFFVFLIRITYVAAFNYYDAWQFYSILIALFSIFVGSFGGLRQRKLKTLLAYSSVSHMGYVLLAFSAGSRFGAEMLLFYLVIYMLSGIGVWFVILSTRINRKRYTDKFSKELGDLVLLRKSNPAFALSLTLTMFSIAGIPPLVGFFAKMGIFLSVLHVQYYFVALLAILCSVVSTFYYIRIIKILYFENLLVGKLYYPLINAKISLFSILIFLLAFLFINPTLLYLIVYKVVLCSFSGDTLVLYSNII